MNLLKNKLKLLLTVGLAAALFSCNNNSEKKDDQTTVKDTAVAATPAPAPAAFTPFDIVEIAHKVKDYDKWRPAFNTDSTARRASGLKDIVVGRSMDDPNNLLVVLEASDVQKAKAFAADPRLKDVMEKNGVSSKPDVAYYHVVRFNPDSKEKKWVRIIHKVKDYDTWLKAFDGEGTAAREAQGLYDVALARGIDDPSMVYIVFDIKDLEKAKASIMSEEKKKLMTSAGVEGKPKIEFYTSAD